MVRCCKSTWQESIPVNDERLQRQVMHRLMLRMVHRILHRLVHHLVHPADFVMAGTKGLARIEK